MKKSVLTVLIISLSLSVRAQNPQDLLKKMPPEVANEYKDTVDQWGLVFADQLARYNRLYMEKGKDLPYLIGWETALRKILPVKYWFKGKVEEQVEIKSARKEWEAFQIAVLPRIGEELKGVSITVSALKGPNGAQIDRKFIHVYRMGYVKTPAAGYPVIHVGWWPDALLPQDKVDAPCPDLAAFWIDVYVDAKLPAGDYTGEAAISAEGKPTRKIPVHLKVWDFELPERTLPQVVFTKDQHPDGKAMEKEDYRKLCEMFLEHNTDPSELEPFLKGDKSEKVKELKYFIDRGLRAFPIPANEEMYQIVKENNWLDLAYYYVTDEPDREQFEKDVVPKKKEYEEKYPGLRTATASQGWPKMSRGVDMWITDLSTHYSIETAEEIAAGAERWFYFCHVPIHVDFHAPLGWAPNIQVDNPAVEARTIFYIAYVHKAKGIMYWAGNREWMAANFPDRPLKKWELPANLGGFPYGGLHNGNGYLVYPGPYASIRLKLLRDGAEDYAYLKLLEAKLTGVKDAKTAAGIRELLDPRPEIFVDTHYFSRDPQDIIAYRERMGEMLERAGK